jgi:hypothetical protein
MSELHASVLDEAERTEVIEAICMPRPVFRASPSGKPSGWIVLDSGKKILGYSQDRVSGMFV